MPEPSRKRFLSDAPALRAALTAELSACLARAAALSPDEALLIRHILTHAGLREDGCLYLPSLAVLWGQEPSYIPPVSLPGERARAAAKILRRRGVLVFSGDGVVVAAEVLRTLA
ncbi:MAG: hypothetical protein A2506_10370 [Elusimicrobia bacterium RIFOXYD12_FULL_66_9]|nr:MAG: hypothetical protein A2506_10370 [Elusimicrobia bacterium RIFOXYD12_FULL_66_9]